MLSSHPTDCFTCERNQNCELLKLANELRVTDITMDKELPCFHLDDTSPGIVRDPNKCILCGRCIRVCREVQTVQAIDLINRGDTTTVGTALNNGLGNSVCVNCGQCIHVCPVGAIKEKSSIEYVWDAINDPKKHVVVQEAPAIRASLGEDLGLPAGTLVAGKMHAALRRMGFDKVFDTNFSADLTIMEEASELVGRITGKIKKPIPQLTSCSPGWIKFIEHFYPDLLDNISTCKSPQQMFGALSKTYYPKIAKIDPSTIVSVSIMPCTAKKFEAERQEMNDSGYQDVDYVLTTRELSRMILESGIDFGNLPDEPAEELMGAYSGAATIFGTTGGVMEAAVRTAYKMVTGKEMKNLDIFPLRGIEGVKTASVDFDGLEVKVAVAHGLGNARILLDAIQKGKSPYHFIEIMACPGGCVGGGGQPYGYDMVRRQIRGKTLYKEDRHLPIRVSHDNPAVQDLYKNFLGEPLGHKSHKLLHTTYKKRKKIIYEDEQ